ncbi:ketoacyl-ACP synthase III [Flavobacteriaceae bacterium Ap0902]|nr:ketoacyl-ACP synthase III [Flavobacteriaceae bacterium Ap0902]
MTNAVITGSGHFLPPNVIKNSHFLDHEFYDEAGKKIDKDNQEIIKKFQEITEIEERRYIDDDMTNSQMAAIAGQRALEDAGVDKETLDYVIVATNYGDITKETQQPDMVPSISARVKHHLGIENIRCKPYDMIFGCPGWNEGLILASQFIKANMAKRILVIGSETLSRAIDKFDRSAMIFADGAGAVVLEAKESDKEEGVIHHLTASHNMEEMNYLVNTPSFNPDYRPTSISIGMKGRKVYEYALKNVPASIKQLLDEAKVDIKQIDKILLHQANAKMDHAMIARLYKLFNAAQPEDVDPMTVQKFGNSSVATVPTMFDLVKKGALDDYKFKPDTYVVFASVGAGMNINAILYKFPKSE